MPIADAFRFSYVFHFFMAGVFMFILSRHFKLNRPGSLLSALLFMFNGFLITRMYAGNYTLITTVPWIPIIFYLFDKFLESGNYTYLVLFSLSSACQFLGGHPQPAYYTLFTLGLYTLYISYYRFKDKEGTGKTMSPFILYFIGVILVFGLCAIQLVPSQELFGFSASRAGGAPYKFATSSSLNFYHLLLFFFPKIFGIPNDDTYWVDDSGYVEVSGYIGIAALILVVWSVWFVKCRRVRFFGILIFISFFLALGRNNPIYPILYNIIPGIKMFRCPGRWLMIVHFGLAYLAGVGLDSLVQKQIDSIKVKKILWVVSGLGVFFIVFYFGLLLYQDGITHWLLEYQVRSMARFTMLPIEQIYAMVPEQAMQLRYYTILHQVGLSLFFWLLTFLIFLGILKDKLKISMAGCLLIGLILIDVWVFGYGFMESEPKSEYLKRFQHSDGIQFLQEDNKDLFRILSLDSMLSWQYNTEKFEYRPNRLMIHHINETRGYDPTILKHYAEYLNLMQHFPVDMDQGGLAHIPTHAQLNPTLVSLLNVKYVCSYPQIDMGPHFPHVFEGRINIYKNENYLPRAFFVPSAKIIPEKTYRLKEMNSPQFNPTEYLILESKPSGIPDFLFQTNSTISTHSLQNSITLIGTHPDYTQWDVNLVQDGFILFSELWYPGWTLLANGKEIPLYQADHAFRAAYLTKGKYQLSMVFYSKTYYWGRKISEFFILILIGLLALQFIQKKRRL